MTDRRYVVRRTRRIVGRAVVDFAERVVVAGTPTVWWTALDYATLVNAAQAAVLVATCDCGPNQSADACEVADPERWPASAKLLDLDDAP